MNIYCLTSDYQLELDATLIELVICFALLQFATAGKSVVGLESGGILKSGTTDTLDLVIDISEQENITIVLSRFSVELGNYVLNIRRNHRRLLNYGNLNSTATTASVPMTEAGKLQNGLDSELKISRRPEWGFATQLLRHEVPTLDNPYDASSLPIYQTTTFKQKLADDRELYAYTRGGNPTRDALESLCAKLDGGDRAFCFVSGMAALTTVTHLIKPGEEIVVGHIYGGSYRILEMITKKVGIIVTTVDMTKLPEVEAAVGPTTKIVWLEGVTNPCQRIADIRKVADIAHKNGALLMVDNTMMSPVLSKPMELGADIVMHSATKFLSGHNDVMAGVLVVKDESLAKEIYFLQNSEGAGLAPFDCWLMLRGMKTLVLRVEKQQQSAQKIAEFLVKHPRIKQVSYVGLPGHEGHDLHYSQAKGAGSVLSITTGSLAVSKHIVEQTKLFGITVSFGSVTSTISLPSFMSHMIIPAHIRQQQGISQDLIRISIGIEDVEDLIEDLNSAINSAPSEN